MDTPNRVPLKVTPINTPEDLEEYLETGEVILAETSTLDTFELESFDNTLQEDIIEVYERMAYDGY